MTRIADVAQRAGVSKSTVSHVLNETRHVNPDTRRRVLDAIDATGFRPNRIAQSLATANTATVGIATSSFANPYFADIIFAIEAECARLGLMAFLCDTKDDAPQEHRVVQALHERRVAGIILTPSRDAAASTLPFIARTRIPCVLVDRMPDKRFDQVGVGNATATRILVEHLIGHGHRRIAFVAGQRGFSTAAERISGYRAALRRHGVAFDRRLLIASTDSTESAAEAVLALLAGGPAPTAIAAGNNMATIGAMLALGRRGIRVPEQMALVGFDDFAWADFFEPRLTVMAQPCAEIGRQAAALLVERIADPDRPPRSVRLKASLVIRNSCGCIVGAAQHPAAAAREQAA